MVTLTSATSPMPFIGLAVAILALIFAPKDRRMLLFLLGGIQGVLVAAHLASGMIVDTRNEENLIVFVGIRFLAGITSLIISIASVAIVWGGGRD